MAMQKAKLALQNANVLEIKLMETCADAATPDALSFVAKMLNGTDRKLQEIAESYEYLIKNKRLPGSNGQPLPTTPADIKQHRIQKCATLLKGRFLFFPA
jgi:hypothetical protein